MTPRRVLLAALALSTAALSALAHAAPPTRDEIATWCAEAEDTAHCGRLIETQQMKRLPGLATRDGATLKVTLFPSGTTTFADVEDIHGGTVYNLWDNWSEINAVVVSVTRNDRTTYVVLMRGGGRTFELPAEPALAPDRRHLATADFCAKDCTNEVAVWRVSRDGIARDSTWTPAPTWSDAALTWKDADTLAIDYTPMGAADSRTLTRKLGDATWRNAGQ
ncbi:MAG TPA: hypothetical protein VGR63_06940 [Casimicrobiaceae bacterium]|jgi:hypothetical protein|nr:hypothetical protein [Casimicrobiaceae bacterium]